MLGIVVGTRTIPLATEAGRPRRGTSIIDTTVSGGSVTPSCGTLSTLLNFPGLQLCCLENGNTDPNAVEPLLGSAECPEHATISLSLSSSSSSSSHASGMRAKVRTLWEGFRISQRSRIDYK